VSIPEIDFTLLIPTLQYLHLLTLFIPLDSIQLRLGRVSLVLTSNSRHITVQLPEGQADLYVVPFLSFIPSSQLEY